MREIVYRAKRSYKNEWVYGNLVYDDCNRPHVVEKKYFYEDGHHLGYCDDTDRPVFIVPETLGQDTGLEDRHGNPIFEGDILRGGPDEIYRVIWNPYCASFQWEDAIGYSDGFLHLVYPNRMEVIGNIHDNPDLCPDAWKKGNGNEDRRYRAR